MLKPKLRRLYEFSSLYLSRHTPKTRYFEQDSLHTLLLYNQEEPGDSLLRAIRLFLTAEITLAYYGQISYLNSEYSVDFLWWSKIDEIL